MRSWKPGSGSAPQIWKPSTGNYKAFAYNASHDLKAPLRGIAHLAAWLVEDCREAIDARGQEYIDLLIARVKRMEQMIDGILKYSRIGRLEGKQSPIALNALLRDIIDVLAPPAQIQICIAAELPIIIGDATRIQQVFQNLLSNAINCMDKPERRITNHLSGGRRLLAIWV